MSETNKALVQTFDVRKGLTQEAYAYNALVSLWSSVQNRAEEMRRKNAEKYLFDKNED